MTSEINDLVRSRTELECIVEDLKIAKERTGGKREELEEDLSKLQRRIIEKERKLRDIAPKWDEHRAKEGEERRRCAIFLSATHSNLTSFQT